MYCIELGQWVELGLHTSKVLETKVKDYFLPSLSAFNQTSLISLKSHHETLS